MNRKARTFNHRQLKVRANVVLSGKRRPNLFSFLCISFYLQVRNETTTDPSFRLAKPEVISYRLKETLIKIV